VFLSRFARTRDAQTKIAENTAMKGLVKKGTRKNASKTRLVGERATKDSLRYHCDV